MAKLTPISINHGQAAHNRLPTVGPWYGIQLVRRKEVETMLQLLGETLESATLDCSK